MHKLDEKFVAKAIIDKYFQDKLEEKIVILTFASNESQVKRIAEELKKFYDNLREIHTISIKLDLFKESMPKTEIEDALNLMKPGTILLVNYPQTNLAFCTHSFPSSLNGAENIVVFTNAKKTSVHICRNLLQKARPKFAIVVGVDHMDVISSVTNMLEVDDLEEYLVPEAQELILRRSKMMSSRKQK